MPTPQLNPARYIRALLILATLFWAHTRARPADAAQFRVRSVSIGRATQYFRVDRRVAAPRVFTQGMNLWGYDLVGDRSGSFNFHVSMRYTSDFSLTRPERENPYFDQSWNALSLDLAYLDWRPFKPLRLRLGRQWDQSALGTRDFDGLLIGFSPALSPHIRASLRAHAGRDVQSVYSWVDPAHFDVMGLPVEEDRGFWDDEGLHWVAGASAGLRWRRDASVDFSWRRRWSTQVASPWQAQPDLGEGGAAKSRENLTSVLGSEQLGLAASASFHPRVSASGWGSFHTLLQKVDSAGANLAWRLPRVENSLSAGVEHRHPWFDSQSIFNLFGVRPYKSGFLGYQHRLEQLQTDLNLRAWGRYYPGTHDTSPYSGFQYSPADTRERAMGASAGTLSRARLWDHPFRWGAQLSWERSLDRESEQWLGQLNARVPVFRDQLFLSARGLILAAFRPTPHAPLGRPEPSGHTSPERAAAGYASTGVLGLEFPVSDYGQISVSSVTTAGSLYPINTSFYASFRMEHWP